VTGPPIKVEGAPHHQGRPSTDYTINSKANGTRNSNANGTRHPRLQESHADLGLIEVEVEVGE
jgi:hypothetical protein